MMTSEELEILDEIQHDLDANKSNSRAERLANCQKVTIIARDPHGKKNKISLYQCGLPECAYCSARRGENAKRQVEKAVFENTEKVFMIETDDIDIQKKIRSLGKNNYKCFPQAEDCDQFVIFYSAETSIDGSPSVTPDYIEQLDFVDIAKKRKGKRTSGALGKTLNEENSGTVKVKLPYLVAESNDITLINVSVHQTDIDTAELDPHTEEELKSAMEEVVLADKKNLSAKGINSTIYYKTYHIDLSRIDWLSHIRNKLTYNHKMFSELSLSQLSFTQS